MPPVKDFVAAAECDDVVADLGDPMPAPRPGSALGHQMSALEAEALTQVLARRSEKTKGKDGSSGVFMKEEDYQALLRNIGRKEESKKQYRKLALLLVGIAGLLAAITFSTTFLSVELAKESHVKEGSITDSNGVTVKTKSADLEVCSDGSLATPGRCARFDSAGRRLQESTDAIATIPVKQRHVLTSSLSDTFFMSLDEVAVFSDKGHTLRLEIHGFSRIPVLNSRCGNVVHLYTAWNGRLTLDSDHLSFDSATEAAFVNAGFSLALGGIGGRRLAEEHTVDGFFSAVQGVEDSGVWTCQDVPLPKLPEFYSQELSVYRPCAVEGVTGQSLDMCDSKYGGVLPGVIPLPRDLQLATMTKTERIRAKLSVDVPIERVLFAKSEIETIKSPSYELQVTKYANHPGQVKVHIFDRTTSSDVHFQVVAGKTADGRFFCNSSGTGESTPQKQELAAENAGVERKMHFELMDLVEENGQILRHFRMLPAEAFLEWMGAKAAADRPQDSYYEYWDLASDMTPVRLLNPDGSLVVFQSSNPAGATDAHIQAKLQELGAGSWSALMTCSAEEKKIGGTSPSVGIEVPMINGPMMDLEQEEFSFYAKLNLDQQVEDASSSGWETLGKRAVGSGPLADFAQYALRSRHDFAMADLCRDTCAANLHALEVEMNATADASWELCNATKLGAVIQCLIDTAAAKSSLCLKNNLMTIVNTECLQDADTGRRLSSSTDMEPMDVSLDGSEEYLRRLGAIQDEHLGKYKKTGETKQGQMSHLKDGSYSIDLSALDASQRAQLASALGVQALSTGRVVFNATDNLPKQKVSAMLEASENEGSVHSRRLMLDMNCMAPGVGPGCIFSVGYPWGCDPIDGNPKCKFGIAVKMQVGGPAHGALSIGGAGCVEEWAFGVPKPFSGSVCIDGGIGVSWSGACGLPFSLSGQVGLTASVGLDLVLFSFSLASIRIEAGAGIENYKYNCDDRRRRRRGWGGRRRGADQECQTGCDFYVYAKGTLQVFVGRIWAMAKYYFRHKDFDFIIGADIYIWAIFTSWWETVAQVQIV